MQKHRHGLLYQMDGVMVELIKYLIVLIIGATIPTVILLGQWPDEHTFDNGSICTVLALQNLQNEPDINMSVIYREAHKVNRTRQNRKVPKRRSK